MKQLFAYCLCFVLMLLFHYRTINFCFSISNSSEYFQDIDCEEESNESEKSDEKNEKKDFLEYLFFDKAHELMMFNLQSFNKRLESLYATYDYSIGVYSPPEHFTI